MELETWHNLLSLKFKYSNVRYEHERKFMTIWGIMSYIGGFANVVIGVFGMLAFSSNKYLQEGKYIRSLFFVKMKKNKERNYRTIEKFKL